MFNLTVDPNIHLRTFHPDDAGEIFNLMERNRARLRPWMGLKQKTRSQIERVFVRVAGTGLEPATSGL